VQVWLDGRAMSRRIQFSFLFQLDGMLFSDNKNNQQKQEIRLDVMGGRNSTITPAQSLFRCKQYDV